MSKDEGGRNSSFSEKPVRSRLRRLVDWINLTGAKKVHSKDALRKIWKEIRGGSEWIVDGDLRDFLDPSPQ
jgi:hypothetical protein